MESPSQYHPLLVTGSPVMASEQKTAIATDAGSRRAVPAQVRRAMTIFFFFQAEDGIRDVAVTGVQTCALPISIDQRVSHHDHDEDHDHDDFDSYVIDLPAVDRDRLLAALETLVEQHSILRVKGDRKSVV